jgi:gas vesicle protein
MNRQQWTSLGLGALTGAAVGGVIALFFAPESGKEIRQQIMGKTNKVIETGKNKISNIRHVIGEKISGEQCIRSDVTSGDGY